VRKLAIDLYKPTTWSKFKKPVPSAILENKTEPGLYTLTHVIITDVDLDSTFEMPLTNHDLSNY